MLNKISFLVSDKKTLDSSKLKASVCDKINMVKMIEFAFERAENIMGNTRKCWSFFPTMFSKAFHLRVCFCKSVKRRTNRTPVFGNAILPCKQVLLSLNKYLFLFL